MMSFSLEPPSMGENPLNVKIKSMDQDMGYAPNRQCHGERIKGWVQEKKKLYAGKVPVKI